MSRSAIIGLCGIALVASGSAARAEDERPVLLPTRDVAVTYAVDHQGPGSPKQARVYYSATTSRLRLETPGEKQIIIFDRAGKTTTMVMMRQHIYLQMPMDPEMEIGFMLTPDMKFTRSGSETIAGHRCTDWTVQSARVTGTACITDDGVLLLGRGKEGTAGGGIQAVEVSFAPLPASLFAPPPEFRKVGIPFTHVGTTGSVGEWKARSIPLLELITLGRFRSSRRGLATRRRARSISDGFAGQPALSVPTAWRTGRHGQCRATYYAVEPAAGRYR